MDGVSHARMTTYSNGKLYRSKVLVSATQIADSTKLSFVSAKVFVNMVHHDADCVAWCILLRPVVH